MISNENTNTLPLPRLFLSKKVAFSAAVLLIFHLVGIWGLVFSGNAIYYQQLTPLNLLLTNLLLFINHRNFTRAFFLFAGITFLASFLAEVIGVHTGLLFGEYAYGEALGLKLWNVPLLIGLNWLMLVYCAGAVARKWFKNYLAAAFAGATIMTLLDFLIEPVAMQTDFWSWHNNNIPAFNFVCWFGLALLLQLLFQKLEINRTNPLASLVLLTQTVFFLVLNLFL